jgi:hypothetical protein
MFYHITKTLYLFIGSLMIMIPLLSFIPLFILRIQNEEGTAPRPM